MTRTACAVYDAAVVGRPPETETVVRAKRGDADAYEALMRPHEHIAFRTAYAIVGSAADAEEVTQEAFVKAYNALPRFRTGAGGQPGDRGGPNDRGLPAPLGGLGETGAVPPGRSAKPS